MTKIVVKKGIFKNFSWKENLSPHISKIAIITDTHVAPLYGEQLQKKIEEEGMLCSLFTVPPGEKSKTRGEKEILEDSLCREKFGRDSLIIALGGGVITDLAGFVAATYMRGIPYFSFPTSLMAMVDASIGGKVGVNTPYGKNLIGAIYLPKMILIDPDVLKTLPEKEMRNGKAEIVKYGLIASGKLESHITSGLIKKCISIKREIVKKDPFESGLRRILNFGHTIAHALESASNYSVSHGEAVSVGMCVEAKLSALFKFIPESEVVILRDFLIKEGFSLKIPAHITHTQLWEHMHQDKKAGLGKPRFVLLEKIGQAKSFDGNYCSPVDFSLVEEALNSL